MKKIQIMRKKLIGIRSTDIMWTEINECREHKKQKYFKVLKEVIYGDKDSVRYNTRKGVLTPAE